ncbi:hypothetical protein ACLB2K_052771 [Fragaria x ananassa]
MASPTLACFTLLISVISTTTITTSFTVDLIHRDSPLSPSYDSSTTHFRRLHESFLRSIARASRFTHAAATPTIESTVISSSGEYLMNLSVGTPPVQLLGIADTGSDLIWTQCKPCKQCFNQNPPLFDPAHSSTYKTLPCQSNTCQYSYRYGDRSYTHGSLSVETFIVGKVSLPKIVFGCGHDNGGTFDESGSGLIGLGGGPLSFISQLSKSTNGGKFSYCLVPTAAKSDVASKISFGSASIVSGAGTVSTSLVSKQPNTFYYLTLEAISVGEKKVLYKSQSNKAVAGSEGNIIIDSGTTLTLLPPGFHDDVVAVLEAAINAERVSDPRGVLSLCFKSKKDDIGVPVITAHFSGGADVKLNALNTFARVEDDMVCFTMIPADDVAIFGNLAQINFLVGYDLDEGTVSFKPTDCTKHR